ncbi:DUF262 domain-containing HNH endonuclease family protein [Okeania sp. KiyG1]|uniref:DUF262 domain-containing protein n=1 Tax=Okeania sp. KiyG1 TaxID=2720165 RepID=UPI001922C3CF|nr:DUF262 domain-containing HNH endonuclease family protein [Okeania sp. KiyG1]GGA00915.1 hypothetical protein CYANOKiyG1_12690 [Okeania sp. KiyG1]
MVDISSAFITRSETVLEFFQRPGVGLYIPLYQRQYSWDKENIDQLMEDICHGVEMRVEQDNAIRFLGTIISVVESNSDANINPKDKKALPTRIENIIDGQQRISTIAILACLLYQKIVNILNQLLDEIKNHGMEEAAKSYLDKLLGIFSLDLQRGLPQRKPIIIRGEIDNWTYAGNENDYYKSDISLYIASFISAIIEKEKEEKEQGEKKVKIQFPKPPRDSLVEKNIKLINTWLRKVEKAYDGDGNNSYPTAWKILDSRLSQKSLWSYERPELYDRVLCNSNPMSAQDKRVCSLVQIFAFCHYLLDCCCFTVIEPKTTDWAFDMFQSLNATGTPLTAIETFKPIVVNYCNLNNNNGSGFRGSKSEEYFSQLEELLGTEKTAASKNKLTNEYLTTFGAYYNGENKPPRQFSTQRKWLNDKYSNENECKTYEEKEDFIRCMADIADYWKNIIQFEPNKYSALPKTDKVTESDRKESAICVMYLEDANHKMARALLSRFYSLVLRDEPGRDSEFVYACKKVAAFFTLWRSALPNTGLDDAYRKILRTKMSWKTCNEKGNKQLNKETLSECFMDELKEKKIGTKEEWKNRAVSYLLYDNNIKKVCKFVLFVTAHDTIPDPDYPGLMKPSSPGTCLYLEPNKWVSKDFNSIEHIAPQKQSEKEEFTQAWDDSLNYESIGNLTLLPTEINSSVSNKTWIGKWIYYKHLAESNPDIIKDLKQEAKDSEVKLEQKTINLFKQASFQHHIEPIVKLGKDGTWNKKLVQDRTERICDILWDRMYQWLSE